MTTWARAGGSLMPPADARAWLLRMHAAANERNYQGTLVVSADGQMSSSRLAHYCEGPKTYERIDVLDGQARRMLRHDDKVVTLWPATKTARIEQRDAVAVFPSILTGSEQQLLDRYDMFAQGSGRVAGHEAAVFLLKPRDGLRFAQRFWAEHKTGLLLRADVLAPDGRVLETSAFTDLEINVKPQPDSVLLPMKRLDGFRVVKSAPLRTSLEAEGWRLQGTVAGFRQVSCVKRSFESTEDERGGVAAAVEVLQTIYSDGLTHVSVFIEPRQPERHKVGKGMVGATHTLMQPVGDQHWVTVMGDVPFATLKQFVEALERTR